MRVNSWNGSLRAKLALLGVVGAALVGCGGGSGNQTSTPLAAGETKKQAMAAGASASASTAQLGVTLLSKVSETRVSRTVYDFVYTVKVQNGPFAMPGARATLTGVGAGSSIVDGSVVVGDMNPGDAATPSDTVTIRHDRAVPFNPAALVWHVIDQHRVAGMVYALPTTATGPSGDIVSVQVMTRDGLRTVSTTPVPSTEAAAIRTRLVRGNLVDWIPGSSASQVQVAADAVETFNLILAKGTSAAAQFDMSKFGPGVSRHNNAPGPMVAAGW